MEFPEELKYTEEHEWVMVEEELAVIGISDFAQDALGDVVFVELPEVGTLLEAGKAFGVVESVKAVSDIYAPLSGKVSQVNEALAQNPELLNSDPYGDGWICEIELSDPAQFEQLLTSSAYQNLIGG
mgnify:CR=1 FL=1